MILFYLLVAVMPLVKHPLWSLTKFGDVTLNKYLGLVCLVVALFHVLGRQTPLRLFDGWLPKLFVAFGVATILSFTVAGSDVAIEVSPIGNWVSFVLLLFTAAVLIDSVDRLRWTLVCLVGGVAFTSLHLLKEWINGGMSAGYRPGWVTGDPNYFALMALLVLPIGFLLAVRTGLPTYQRLFCLGCFVVTFAAFTLSGSRGGFLGLVMGLLFLIHRSPNRMRYFAACGVIFVMLALAPTGPVSRFINPDKGDERSTHVRTALLIAGIQMFQDHFWTGIGVGRYKAFIAEYSPEDEKLRNVAHNTYLEVGTELGIAGLLALVGIFYGGIRRVRSVGRPAPDPVIETAALGIELGLISAAVGIFFLSALHIRLLWFVVILAMRLPVLAMDLASPAPAPQRVPPRQVMQTARA